MNQLNLKQMHSDGLTNLESKISSAEGTFSTSDSNDSKNPNKLTSSKMEAQEGKPQQVGQLEEVNQLTRKTEQESDISSRLFTFMDEKQGERKLIHDYIFKNDPARHETMYEGQENRQASNNNEIVKMFGDSRKKRNHFLKKLLKNPVSLKQDKSISKLSKMGKSKTPKNLLPYVQNKYETLQPRSKSKTPKMKISTPRNQNEPKLFRANSNFSRQGKCIMQPRLSKQSKVQPLFKKCQEQSQEISKLKQSLEHKDLLKKKKELEKQLLLINQSLLICKKTDNPKRKKQGKQSCKPQSKKQKGKSGRF